MHVSVATWESNDSSTSSEFSQIWEATDLVPRSTCNYLYTTSSLKLQLNHFMGLTLRDVSILILKIRNSCFGEMGTSQLLKQVCSSKSLQHLDTIVGWWIDPTPESNLLLNPKYNPAAEGALERRPVEHFPPPKITYSGYIYVGRRGGRSLRLPAHMLPFCKFPISQNVRPPRSDDRKKRLETLDGGDGDDTHTKMNPSCCILKQEESQKLGSSLCRRRMLSKIS